MVKDAKYLVICRELAADIQAGRLRAGDKLPTERELADRFGVHRMTIRQATDRLVKRGLVEKQLPRGVFVREHRGPQATLSRLNLICLATESSHASVFIEHGTSRAVQRNMQPRVIRVFPGDEHLAADAVQGGDPSLLLGVDLRPQTEIYRAMRRAEGRAVALGVRLDHAGIPTVVGDDHLGIRLAVDHLWEQGHRRIALVAAITEEDVPLHEIMIQWWREAMRTHLGASTDPVANAIAPGWNGNGSRGRKQSDGLDEHIIRLSPVPIGGPAVAAYEAVKRYLKRTRDRATAFLALAEPTADGTAAALYHEGLRVPQDVSLMTYAGTYYSALSLPPRTSVTVSIKQHIDLALAMIDTAMAGELPEEERLRIVKPRLVTRQSVAPPPSGTTGSSD